MLIVLHCSVGCTLCRAGYVNELAVRVVCACGYQLV